MKLECLAGCEAVCAESGIGTDLIHITGSGVALIPSLLISHRIIIAPADVPEFLDARTEEQAAVRAVVLHEVIGLNLRLVVTDRDCRRIGSHEDRTRRTKPDTAAGAGGVFVDIVFAAGVKIVVRLIVISNSFPCLAEIVQIIVRVGIMAGRGLVVVDAVRAVRSDVDTGGGGAVVEDIRCVL